MTARKKRLHTREASASSAPRATEPTDGAANGAYPTGYQALATPDLRALIRAAVRAVTCAGVVAAGAAGVGCADPVCASSPLEELTVHGGNGVSYAFDLELSAALDELAVGAGINAHPMMLPGAMPVAYPGVIGPPTNPDPHLGVEVDPEIEPDLADPNVEPELTEP